MTPGWPCLHLARVTLETTTPLSIGTGLGAGLYDTALVRDANGLPAIPGTTIAGVMRHVYARVFEPGHGSGPAALFGQARKGDDRPSRLHVTWAAIHDQADRPVEGLVLGPEVDALRTDPVLAWALAEQPLARDHVRIDHRGSADGEGKFDRTALPPGYRFSFEMSLWSASTDEAQLAALLGLLGHPAFRLGGATRRGLGRVKVMRARSVTLDLATVAGREALAAVPAELGSTPARLGTRDGFEEAVRREAPIDALTATVRLEPLDFWRFGQGDGTRTLTATGKPADLLPVRERAVRWVRQPDGSETGQITERRLVVAASGVKGALRHRVAFHYARLHGHFADDLTSEQIAAWTNANGALLELFGTAKDTSDGDDGQNDVGQAGRLIIDDAFVDDQGGAIMAHSSIDRFTGGVRDGFLFSEELAHRGQIELELALLEPTRIARQCPLGREALRLALVDLIEGRLALGGGGGRGHGFCGGCIKWSDEGAWIEGRAP